MALGGEITSQGRKEKKGRRHTEMNKRGLSPLRDTNRKSALTTGSAASLFDEEEDDLVDELTEMEVFMQHLQKLDPDKVKRVLTDHHSVQA